MGTIMELKLHLFKRSAVSRWSKAQQPPSHQASRKAHKLSSTQIRSLQIQQLKHNNSNTKVALRSLLRVKVESHLF